ncbi:MAG: cyclophilin-like fold protein [Sphaerochaetaceae bacterium]
MRKTFFACLAFAIFLATALSAQGNTEQRLQPIKKETSMLIQIRIGDRQLIIEMEDNPTSRDFASMLPLELEFSDYADTEKISHLLGKIDTTNAPNGYDPSVGDQ